MNALEIADDHLTGWAAELEQLAQMSITVEGVASSYAVTMLRRVTSTYLAMAHLLRRGHHDEMVLLLRRQLEDSMRLHYLVAHGDHADRLVIGHLIARERSVLRRIDGALNRTKAEDVERTALIAMANERRDRIRELYADAAARGVGVEERFPRFEDMAEELGRQRDLLPYASASEVSHSAVSAVTDSYIEDVESERGQVRMVALGSENRHARVSFARVAINTTAIAVAQALELLNMRTEGQTIARAAATRIAALKEAAEVLTSGSSTAVPKTQ